MLTLKIKHESDYVASVHLSTAAGLATLQAGLWWPSTAQHHTSRARLSRGGSSPHVSSSYSWFNAASERPALYM
jgi:hypothetical protein